MKMFTVLIFCLSLFLAQAQPVAEWTLKARHLFEEDLALKKQSIASLKEITTLESDLRAAMKSENNRELAVDVIAQLKIKELVPELIALADADQSLVGIYKALLMFEDATSKKLILHHVEKLQTKFQQANDMAMGFVLVIARRDKHYIQKDFILQMMTQNNPVLKDLSLDYLEENYSKMHYEYNDWNSLSSIVFSNKPFQTRLRYTALIKKNGQLKNFNYLCDKNLNLSVRKACKEGGVP